MKKAGRINLLFLGIANRDFGRMSLASFDAGSAECDLLAVYPAALKIDILPSDRSDIRMASADNLERAASAGNALTSHILFIIVKTTMQLIQLFYVSSVYHTLMDLTIASILPVAIAVAALLISLTVHEFSHALAAYVQGDMTAYDAGRLTLNPVPHIDLMGTILLPGFLLLAGSPVMFGWAKPVPFNPLNLRNGRHGSLIVGLAGPLSNIVMCLLAGVALKFSLGAYDASNFLILFLATLMVMNFVLGVFNLIPIPPLDGSKILESVASQRMVPVIEFLEQYGNYLLIALLIINATVYPFLGIFLEKGIGVITRLLDISF